MNEQQALERLRDMRTACGVIARGIDRLEADFNVESVKSIPVVPAKFSYGGEPRSSSDPTKRVDRDPTKLLPPFAAKVEELFLAVRRRGHAPFLWEGFRTFERAEMLKAKGTGIAKSMHCYGAAVDIVDSDDTPWDAPPAFWRAIEEEALALQLHVLYDDAGHRRDLPHVQAVSVSIERKFREMTEQERIAFLVSLWS